MKKWYVCFLLMAVLGGMAGCSSDMDDDGIYLDENMSEAWTGEGLPVWLEERHFQFVLHSTHWVTDSYPSRPLWKGYKFYHEGTLMLALTYEWVGYQDKWEEGSICYDAYGRAVNFSKVSDSFKEGAELIWTNEIGTEESMPQLPAWGIENVRSLEWLQEAVDETCREVRKAGNYIVFFSVSCCVDNSDKGKMFWMIKYDYVDRLEKKRIVTRKMYTQDGDKMDIDSLTGMDIECVDGGGSISLTFSYTPERE